MLRAKNQNRRAKALITGGTSGIGLALAIGFAEEGYEVLSAGLGEMPENQDRIEFMSVDVRDQGSIKQLVKTRDHLDGPGECCVNHSQERGTETRSVRKDC